MTQPVIYAAMIDDTVRLWLTCELCGGQIFLVSGAKSLVRPPCPCCGRDIHEEAAPLVATA